MQIVCIIALVCALVSGIVALVTDRTICYRLLNATPFTAAIDSNTVSLGYGDKVHMYATLAVYTALFIEQLWMLIVIYRCYCHLIERREYMMYCFEYSTPLRTVHVRVPQDGTR